MGIATDVSTKLGERTPFLALGMSIGMLVMRGGTGTPEVRALALAALAGIVVVMTLLSMRVRSVDHGEEAQPPGWRELAVEAIGGRGRAFVFLTTYLTFLFICTYSDGSPPVSRVSWLGPVFAAVAGVVLLLAIVSVVRRHLRSEGVERQVFLESTCIGFFVMVLVAGTYAVFEALADAPLLPAWVVWVTGAGTWALASGVRGRRSV